jgi:hypothetical protein
MSKVLTATAATIIILAIAAMRLAPALAANYHDYHAWSHPTVHVNDHPGYAGPALLHRSSNPQALGRPQRQTRR